MTWTATENSKAQSIQRKGDQDDLRTGGKDGVL